MQNNQLIKGLTRYLEGFLDNLTPFLGWVRELKDYPTLKADVIAGVTVALVLVPQSMAYAQLAGLPPYYGLYASFLPVMIAALFGSSRQLATGPVAVVSLLTASGLGTIGITNAEEYIAYAISLALLVGIFQLIVGFVRLGILIAFLSHPVVIGFTTAAAIVIITSQIDKVFGVEVETAAHHYETVWMTIVAGLQAPHYLTLAVTALALAIMIVLRLKAPKMPGILIAVVVTTLASWYFELMDRGVKVVGDIPQGLPGLVIPTLDFAVIPQLLGIAATIALIGFMEAISVAKAMAASTRQNIDADQELIGQGLSNITSSFFQGYAVSGSFSRSAVNIQAGAITGFSSVVTGLGVALALLLLTPLLYHLPQATLAAVIILAVYSLVHVKEFMYAWRVQKHDGTVAFTTFVLTLFYAPHLENGILVGIMMSLGLFIYRTMRPHISILSRHKDGSLVDASKHILPQCRKISIIRFEGSLFFANTNYFENRVLERVASMPDLKFIVIDAVAINEIDATGEAMLHNLARKLVENGIYFLFVRVQGPVMDTFIRTGFASKEWLECFLTTRQEALQYAWKKMNDAGDTKCSDKNCNMPNFRGCLLRSEDEKPGVFLSRLYGHTVIKKSTADLS